MKTKFLLIALVVCLFSNAQAQVPSYVPTNGLVGWWPFNGNANDESGNGNNGTLNGPTPTADRFGNANKAYSFDGVDDYISTNYSGVLGNSNRSVSFWAKHNNIFDSTQCASCSRKPVISYGSNVMGPSQIGKGFYCEFNIGLTGISFDGNETAAGYSTPSPVNDLNWHNYIFVFNNVTNASSVNVYQDGILLTQLSYTYLPTFTLNTILGSNMEFGRRTYNQQFPTYYSGELDDIGFWNRALTQQEITNLYNSSAYVPCASPAFPANLANGLVGYWPFCGDANDESGNSNNGTVNGATLTSDRFGNPNSAYDFDGVDDYINCGHIATLDGLSSATLSAWFNYNTIVNASRIFTQELVSSSTNGFGLCISDFYAPNTIQSITRNSQNTVQYSNSFLQPNTYYHAVLVFDGNASTNNQKIKMYINGNLIPMNYVGTIPNTLPTNNYESWIGGQYNVPSGPTAAPFDGTIDDIAIWNRALNASEIQQLYNTGIYFQTVTGSCDTLQFNANITGFNPVTYQNQVKVFPNPAKDNLVIDCGANFNALTGYSMKILNTVGQSVYNSLITQQVTNIPLTAPTWSPGAYIVQFINPSGTVIEAKQIIIQ